METWIVLVKLVERGVLVLLLGLSIWSVAIMIDRYRFFKRANLDNDLQDAKKLIGQRDKQKLQAWAAQGDSFVRLLVKTLLEGSAVDRLAQSFFNEKRGELEKGFNVLATLGSNAPFIGLFGTVLGIVQAFAILGQQGGGANDVMVSISLALIATAAGLFVAIPAVIAYNVYSQRVLGILRRAEALKDYYVSQNGG